MLYDIKYKLISVPQSHKYLHILLKDIEKCLNFFENTNLLHSIQVYFLVINHKFNRGLKYEFLFNNLKKDKSMDIFINYLQSVLSIFYGNDVNMRLIKINPLYSFHQDKLYRSEFLEFE